MISTFDSYTLIAVIAAGTIFIFGIMLVFGSILRRNPASIALTICALLWVGGIGMTNLVALPAIQMAGFFLQYSALSLLVPFLILTSQVFSGKALVNPWVISIVFGGLSAAFVCLILSSPNNGLIFSRIWRSAAGELLRSSGPLYPILVFYVVGSVFLSILLVLRGMRSLNLHDSRRSLVLVFAYAMPTLTAIAEIAGFRALGTTTLVPFAMMLSALLLIWAVLNAQRVSPVVLAHETLVNTMADPILVVDVHSRIVYANQAAQILMRSSDFTPGRFLVDALPELANLENPGLDDDFVIALGTAKYTVRILPVTGLSAGAKDLPTARLFALHDVTSMMTARNELEVLVSERTALLELEIERYRAAKAELEQTVGEKEVLLQELHHRVKNNLQIIISLLNLQSSRIDDGVTMQSVLLAMKTRIQSISLVHERMYQTRFHDGVDFGEYVVELVQGIANLYGQLPVQLDLKVPVGIYRASMDFCLDFGLIVNELVANAFKHGLAPVGHGQIGVELSTQGSCALLRVWDSGPGFPEESEEKSRSLGMNIVQVLSQKHHATITITRGGGGEISITIPLGPDGISNLSIMQT